MSTRKPRIALIATGGTIAGTAASPTDTTGYSAGRLGAEDLLAAVPQLAELADIRAEQPFSIDSKDMGPAHWLVLLRRVQALADAADVDGIVITHGTDTLEETAYFLHIALATAKPVVMTAAMRPATALSADGPLNLYQAVQLACRPAAGRAGVLAVLGGRILPAARLAKRHPSAVDAFGSPDALTVDAGDALLQGLAPYRRHRISLPDSIQVLPPVELLTVAAGSSPALAAAVVRALARASLLSGGAGLVLALPGNASLPDSWEIALTEVLPHTLPVVLASRCGAGTTAHFAGRPGNWLQCSALDPLKARVRLIAGLGAGLRGARLKRWFERG
ncbi:asparaginase [Thauera linaloolentis]|uniref:Asparaginase n=1 Tax=Thauera linaloolentis (strain DSM 12138 / JCM 21573 / CCUG 41526 / CIP 105981 / IAM 15112 / NBRC 102519 / 47Lol) TaxID=1123367 RepID=N6YDR6_THAL4|nr:asparaginase [Thauera linaloolentis]ENO89685.1 asparaginase [Thauera linaloolentis 47Lol = DSM 12138]MCM8567165.1 asparaginase [Thauera linaloolentis]